jgi:hypothetical protein
MESEIHTSTSSPSSRSFASTFARLNHPTLDALRAAAAVWLTCWRKVLLLGANRPDSLFLAHGEDEREKSEEACCSEGARDASRHFGMLFNILPRLDLLG